MDEDAELERPTRVSITDTRDGSLRLVDLPASYSFRSLARGPEGEGLVLGTDGVLRVIDLAKGETAREIPVTGEWAEPQEWQDPRPTVHVQGETAYVTDPERTALHLVDLPSGEIVTSVTLPHVPNEVTGTAGSTGRTGRDFLHL